MKRIAIACLCVALLASVSVSLPAQETPDTKLATDEAVRRKALAIDLDKKLEEAEHALWRAVGLSIHPDESEIGWPRIAASFEFFRALRFEDEFDVHLRIAEMANKTIRYACELKKDDQTIAAGTMTIACVRKKPSMQAIEIPDDVRARLTHV